jgi:AraC-like DNA-binding protein
MNESRLGELTEQESTPTFLKYKSKGKSGMDSVLSDEFDPRPAPGRQMPAAEFFGTSRARSINKTKAASSAHATSEIRRLIINECERWHANDGAFQTAIPGAMLYRFSAPTELAPVFLEPRISVALQGTKRIVLGDEEYVYGDSHFFLTAVDVPVVAQILEATREKPYLCFLLKLDLDMARQMISDFGFVVDPLGPVPEGTATKDSILPRYGVSTGPATHELLDAIYRLLRLLSTPSDIPILSNLIKREIIYRLLTSEHGYRLRQIAFNGSYDHRIARTIALLKQNYAKPLSIEKLAKAAGMGVSTLHHHFKTLTSISPLQYQKQLRLHEARRLLLAGACDAGSAAFEVGYESRSQFTREYRRLFGEPPMRNIKAIKGVV